MSWEQEHRATNKQGRAEDRRGLLFSITASLCEANAHPEKNVQSRNCNFFINGHCLKITLREGL